MTTRRIVTGHAGDGRSIIVQDALVPHVHIVPGAVFDEVWSTGQSPAPLGLTPEGEPTEARPLIGPPAGGSLIRVIDFLPAGAGGVCSPMHRTRSIDYGIVLSGEVVLILSESETLLRPGDVVIQRGTDHAWENRSDQPARMAFVLIDALFDTDLQALIAGQELTP